MGLLLKGVKIHFPDTGQELGSCNLFLGPTHLTSLNHSVHNASQILNETMGSQYRKLCLLSFIGMALSGLMAFGRGVFYAQRNAYALPADFIKMYALGLSVKEAPSMPKTDLSKQKTKGKGVQKNKGTGSGG